MLNINKIIFGVALDDENGQPSVGCRAAAEQARALAQKTDAEVILVNSTHKTGRSDASAREGAEVLAAELNKALVKTTIEIGAAEPWRELIEAGTRHQADLTIISKRTIADHSQGRRGSTAKHLQRESPLPVWVVEPTGPIVSSRVVAATDLSEVGGKCVQFAAEVCRLFNTELHVVSAYNITTEQQFEAGRLSADEADAMLSQIRKDARTGCANQVKGLNLPVEPKVHVAQQAASTVIKAAVTEFEAELLVLGTRSRSGLAGAIIGNTAERILDDVHCSMITVKP